MADDLTSTPACPVLVTPPGKAGVGSTRVCGTRLTTDEQRDAQMCGLHLNAHRSRLAKNAARQHARAAFKLASDRADQLVAELTAAGLQVTSGIDDRDRVFLRLNLDTGQELRDLLLAAADQGITLQSQ
ncbi:hypothetical protein Lfu02_15240 [Longispora fulva]|uniref:Uncharacterized protein n=1 Tax=Longispora fulva TaxID=619741 RepID=A0A8J7KNP1_9ACTN|nr:hypothetical protein [Longispora fulva]MBG6140466.1 hypothetical protein [Longispora fulva]GIG57152.1 hypothetical protein Lfu02_15240 [Longispora fulva]